MAEATETLEPVRAPHLFATGFNIVGAGSEIVVLLLQNELQLDQDGVSQNTAQSPVAMLHLSVQSAKELHLILSQTISTYEGLFGSVTSPFLNSLEVKNG